MKIQQWQLRKITEPRRQAIHGRRRAMVQSCSPVVSRCRHGATEGELPMNAKEAAEQIAELYCTGRDALFKPPREVYGTFVFDCLSPLTERGPTVESPPLTNDATLPEHVKRVQRMLGPVKSRITQLIVSDSADGVQVLGFDGSEIEPPKPWIIDPDAFRRYPYTSIVKGGA